MFAEYYIYIIVQTLKQSRYSISFTYRAQFYNLCVEGMRGNDTSEVVFVPSVGLKKGYIS